ncbi:MAG: hypothetical protein ACK55Z_18770, partial [bacterium]
ARSITAIIGPAFLVVSVPPSASFGARLGRRLVLSLVLLVLGRRPPVLSCSGSPKENVLIAVLGVQLEPLSVACPSRRAGARAGQLPWIPSQRRTGASRRE